MNEKVILTIAPTGNVPTKELNPHVPITPQEIAAQVYECWKEGASVVHIHTRDENGLPTADIDVNRQVLVELDKYPDCNIIRQLSTGARAGKTYQERGQMLCLAPEMASLATGSSNLPKQANLNDPETIAFLAGEMKKYGVKPEVEVFDVAMIANALQFADKGLIDWPIHFNFVLGVPGSLPASFKNLFFLYEQLPANCTWSVTAVGRQHVELSVMAMLLGGNVRVGIEDNLHFSKGVLNTNVSSVRRIKEIALALGKEIATPDEARKILSIKSR